MNRREFVASLAVISQDWWLPVLDEPAVTLFRDPYLQNVQGNQATVLWATLDMRDAGLEYSTDGVHYAYAPAMPRLFAPSETYLSHSFTQYEAHLAGLNPGTPYVYRVVVGGKPVNTAQPTRFQTAGSGPFSFLVLGDSGEQTAGQSRVANRMLTENPAFVVHTGDIAYMNGSFDQYQRSHFAYYAGLMSRAPFFVTPGNHDCETNDGTPYRALHAFPMGRVQPGDRGRYYSFDWGNAHFVSIDTNSSLDRAIHSTGRMLRWLEEDLASTQQFWKVAFFHHPPYASGANDQDIHTWWVRTHVVPILERYGVHVALSGHEHSYQRTSAIRDSAIASNGVGTVYVTSGGGGANLYPVNLRNPFLASGFSEHHYLRVEVRGSEMVFRAIRQDGTEFDQFRIAPPPALAATEPVSFTTPAGSPTLIRIQGTALAPHAENIPGGPLPEQLQGTSVLLNDVAIPLSYVSNNQVHGVVPLNMSGMLVRLQLMNANGAVETSVTLP